MQLGVALPLWETVSFLPKDLRNSFANSFSSSFPSSYHLHILLHRLAILLLTSIIHAAPNGSIPIWFLSLQCVIFSYLLLFQVC